MLTVSCVRTITPNPLSDVAYWISDPAIIRSPTYALSPAGCPNELVFSVTQADLSTLPASITFDATPGSETISTSELDWLAVGTYSVVVKVTDPKTGLENTDLTFNVVVKCTKSIDIISGTIANIVYEIDLDQPWTLNTPLPIY